MERKKITWAGINPARLTDLQADILPIDKGQLKFKEKYNFFNLTTQFLYSYGAVNIYGQRIIKHSMGSITEESNITLNSLLTISVSI